MIYGEAPEDLSDQFKVIDEQGEDFSHIIDGNSEAAERAALLQAEALS